MNPVYIIRVAGKKAASILLAGLLLLGWPAFSQTDTTSTRKIVVWFSPQHFLINGLHLDIEKPLAAGSRSMVLSPRFYTGLTRTVDVLAGRWSKVRNDNTRVSGFGLEALHRLYLTGKPGYNDKRFYLALGPNIHYFNITFTRPGYREETGDDGLLYYRDGVHTYTQKITRLGMAGMLGMQQPMAIDRLLIDLYIGPGYKYSFSKTNYSTIRYTERPIDFNYSGFYLVAGFKMGIAF